MPSTFALGDVLFSLFTFVILLLLLRRFAWGPIVEQMRKRENHISNEIETAENHRQEAEKYLEEQRVEMEKAREEAQSIIETSRKTAQEQSKEIIRESHEEANRMKDNALADITREREQAVEALRAQVGQLSVLIATKIIEKELDEEEQEKLIQEYVQESGGRL
ncbi:F0F1 ATP synthase subunit B [Marinococcus halotolerans]|uniref:F0F1 ATP synthase subunit B n=1 Tax=Marinococcus halotolerans TaxID=301092 RepID=UPI0003B3ACC8|nr:F0F1 ATP synthase subunit B [Marinococcus halotolerans]